MVWQRMLASVVGSGIGKAIGKVIDYIPGKSESIRNKIENLERRQDELKSKKIRTVREGIELVDIADKLRQLYQKAKNQN